jgi:hypothetical protein
LLDNHTNVYDDNHTIECEFECDYWTSCFDPRPGDLISMNH